MKICGLQKTTLLDFPGHVAATIFTGGCNFRCPFCHNSDLLGNDAPAAFSEDEILAFLKKRRGILEGIAITGGEPTLQDDLADFIRSVRALGYQIKLDTNGYKPDVLKNLCEEGLIDYVAMDIKTCRERYPVVAGIPSLQLDRIEESVDFLLHSSVSCEFRTTVVKELHSAKDFEQIGKWLSGAPKYFLQSYVDSGNVLNPIYTSCSVHELSAYLEIVRPYVGFAALRGVDVDTVL